MEKVEIIQLEKLKEENIELKCALECERETVKKLSHKIEKKTESSRALREKIKFLEGQIDAYRYCLNL